MKKFLTIFSVGLTMLMACHKDAPAPSNLIYQTDFSTDDHTWDTSCSSYYCYKFNNGKYDVGVVEAGYFAYTLVPKVTINSNYFITVDLALQLQDPSKWGAAGIVFDYVDDNNYRVFMISSYGHYYIAQKVNGGYSTLVNWSASSAIDTGSNAVNTLKFTQQQTTEEFFVNGKSLGQYAYGQSPNSKVGFITDTSGMEPTVVVGEFDNLLIEKM